MKKTISLIVLFTITAIVLFYISSIKDKLVDKTTLSAGFNLIDANGKPTSDKDFKGSYKLVFFGFTHCPMVCPTGLTTISSVIEELQQKTKAPIEYFFITVDPDRDTPEVLKEHLSEFNPKIIGLTGSQKQIDEAQRNFKAFSKKGEDDGEGNYLVDHSSYIYFMGPNNEYSAHFSYDMKVEKIVKKIMGSIK